MRVISGFLLIIACFLGTIFFRRYNGAVIPYPGLWYFFFIALGLFGVWLISSSFRRVKNVIEQAANSELNEFKSKAEKIELDFDKCEFKSGSYSHQVEDPNLTSLKLVAPVSPVFMDTEITENVIQSYLTYCDTINGTVHKFISHAFPFDQTTLKFYVLNNKITLYADRFDRGKYLFDLQS